MEHEAPVDTLADRPAEFEVDTFEAIVKAEADGRQDVNVNVNILLSTPLTSFQG